MWQIVQILSFYMKDIRFASNRILLTIISNAMRLIWYIVQILSFWLHIIKSKSKEAT